MAEGDVTRDQAIEAEVSRRISHLEHECDRKTRQLLDSQMQLVQSEKMAALGNLVAGLAHEINTPLGAINSNNEILEAAFAKVRELANLQSAAEGKESAVRMNELLGIVDDSLRTTRLAIERLVRIVRNVRNFARLDEAIWRKSDIHDGIESTLTLLNHELKGRIRVVKEFGTVREIECFPNQLNQVFMNILVNGAHAIDGEGELRIKTWEEGESVHIALSDTGSGIPPEILPRIFDPGFTTKKPGLGTGIGLSICQKIIENHHGLIDVKSWPGHGTTFLIVLPLVQNAERKANGE